MAGILDYLLWRGDLSFAQSEMNEVDSLLLSELSYLNFSGIVQEDKPVLLSEAAKEYFRMGRGKQQNNGDIYKEDYLTMLERMADSKRFSQVCLAGYVQKTDEKQNMQFAAVTFELSKNEIYVAFRGTDDTLLGWKEDFLMSVMDTVPSQKEAVGYLNKMAGQYPRRRIYLGGHSKGGNLAVYAAMQCELRVQKRLEMIYNHDGPGFKSAVFDTARYQAIREKIHTTVPQSSLVGMLLEHDACYTVIKSREKGARQHDGFSWEVCGTAFVRAQEMTSQSRVTNETIRTVLSQMTDEQREQFTKTVFEVLEANHNRTLTDIRIEGPRAVRAMLRTFDGLDKEQRAAMVKIGVKMLQEGFRNAKHEYERISVKK